MPETSDRVVVTVVGCGSPHPDPGRFGTSMVIAYGGSTVMVDCGPATTYKMLRNGIRPKAIDAVLLTHHHFDHTADLGLLLLTRWETELGPQSPALVIGPAGTSRFVDRLVGPEGAFRPDVVARREAPLSQAKVRSYGGILPRPDLTYEARDITAGDRFDLPNGWRVETARAEHVEPFHHSIAYRITAGPATIVITGDTQLCAPVTALARGADLLIAMCTEEEERMRARGLASGQMGTVTTATMAREAGVKAVLITHTSLRLPHSPYRERAIRQVAAGFDGEIFFPDEGDQVVLPLETA